MPGSDQIILCLVLGTYGAFLSGLGLAEGLTGSWKEEMMMSCLESTLGLVLEQSTSMTDSCLKEGGAFWSRTSIDEEILPTK